MSETKCKTCGYPLDIGYNGVLYCTSPEYVCEAIGKRDIQWKISISKIKLSASKLRPSEYNYVIDLIKRGAPHE